MDPPSTAPSSSVPSSSSSFSTQSSCWKKFEEGLKRKGFIFEKLKGVNAEDKRTKIVQAAGITDPLEEGAILTEWQLRVTADQKGGWTRVLLQEGVEPNPGPTTFELEDMMKKAYAYKVNPTIENMFNDIREHEKLRNGIMATHKDLDEWMQLQTDLKDNLIESYSGLWEKLKEIIQQENEKAAPKRQQALSNCHGWKRDLTCDGIEANPGPIYWKDIRGALTDPVAIPRLKNFEDQVLLKNYTQKDIDALPESLIIPLLERHSDRIFEAIVRDAIKEIKESQKMINPPSANLVFGLGWRRELLREGVEPNPGPLFWPKIKRKLLEDSENAYEDEIQAFENWLHDTAKVEVNKIAKLTDENVQEHLKSFPDEGFNKILQKTIKELAYVAAPAPAGQRNRWHNLLQEGIEPNPGPVTTWEDVKNDVKDSKSKTAALQKFEQTVLLKKWKDDEVDLLVESLIKPLLGNDPISLLINEIIKALNKSEKPAPSAKSVLSAGLPQLGPRRASASSPSENISHKEATLQLRVFSLVEDIPWKDQFNSPVWASYQVGTLDSWGSENEIQQQVSNVLQEVISLIGLQGVLKCYQELSIFRLRADIWIVVQATGVPVGVVEVKKPGSKIMESSYLHGQIHDYMVRLRSFHGLKHVFGIVSTYEEWRVYWLPECSEIAQSTKFKLSKESPREEFPGMNEEDEEDEEDEGGDDEDDNNGNWINKEEQSSRVLHGSKVFSWSNQDIVSVLASALLKMASSPHEKVELIDPGRPYIIIDEKEWVWAKVKFSTNFSLKYKTLPSTNTKKFILIADFRGGADGRVWLTCSMSGNVGVIKFAQDPQDSRERLVNELKQWESIWGYKNCRIVDLAGQPALLMPYVRPVIAEGGREKHASDIPKDVRLLAVAAAKEMAHKRVCHQDLNWGHIGIASPVKGQKRRAIMFDLARVRKADEVEALNQMLDALGLTPNGDPVPVPANNDSKPSPV